MIRQAIIVLTPHGAGFLGVTVKTVRHYHKLGLVKEPERDSSGYHRYGSAGAELGLYERDPRAVADPCSSP
ncbi:MerR family transcriptional regulator [Nonomuraea jiangxiensis]|uniref:MerR family regulatory protein n=1 Tax=Nonomuraea jiangxiensis TaxID=633440 RepID=A0A1G9Q0Y5_9ACTN|nr:MerR family transcriptional regulator [Nonomuraea jiangxiensis]SDM04674.1 MerR family regulatory protein [Nonomuraea jiangxiensis]